MRILIFLRKLCSNIRDASISFLFFQYYFNIQLENTHLKIILKTVMSLAIPSSNLIFDCFNWRGNGYSITK